MVEVAEFFGVSHTVVRKDWRARGMPGENGRYALNEIAQWQAERLRDSRTAPEEDDLKRRQEEADTLKKEIDAEQRALNLAKAKSEVIDRAEAMAEIEEMCNDIRARFEQIPAEVATSVPPEFRSDIIADWKHKVHLMLKRMEALSLE